LTASLYNAVVEEGVEQLRGLEQLLIGGEALSVQHVRGGVEKREGRRLINGYGPTEATTLSCCHEIGEADGRAGGRSVLVGPGGGCTAPSQRRSAPVEQWREGGVEWGGRSGGEGERVAHRAGRDRGGVAAGRRSRAGGGGGEGSRRRQAAGRLCRGTSRGDAQRRATARAVAGVAARLPGGGGGRWGGGADAQSPRKGGPPGAGATAGASR